MAGQRTSDIFQDSVRIFLQNRPVNQEVRNSDISARVSGDFAEFRQTWRIVAESRPFSA